MENQYGDTLPERLRKRVDEIGRAVSRNEEEVEEGAFCEIELMREAALLIDSLPPVQKQADVLTRFLPKDTFVRTTISADGGVRVEISMSLETVDQADALRHAIDLAIIPLLQIRANEATE